MSKPLILVTNDDGIQSPGLWALAKAVSGLGDVVVIAPDRQWSGAARARIHNVSGKVTAVEAPGYDVVGAFSVDSSPASTVSKAFAELVAEPIALVVSGINSGHNLGLDVTVSGTIGAAMEGAAYGVPAIAISQGIDPRHFKTGGDGGADYTLAGAYARRFAEHLLAHGLPHDVDVLNINVPMNAAPDAAWRLTRQARLHYYLDVTPRRGEGIWNDPVRIADGDRTGPDSDVQAIADGLVAVTPLSMDFTSRVGLNGDECGRNGGQALWQEVPGREPR